MPNRRKQRGKAKAAAKDAYRERPSKRMGMAGAPVSVSEDLQQFTKFAGSGRGLVMKTMGALYEIASTSLTSSTGAAFFSNDSATRPLSSIQLSPTRPLGWDPIGGTATANASFLSPIWDLIGTAFVRYRVTKLCFHYEPQSSATAAGRLIFAFAEDPAHPLMWDETPTQSELLALADSVAFMPWKSWSLDVTKTLSKELLYTRMTTTDDPSGNQNGLNRFGGFGSIACLTDLTAGTAIKGGILYMETEIEFIEFCPISAAGPSLLLLRSKLDVHVAAHLQRRDGRRKAFLATVAHGKKCPKEEHADLVVIDEKDCSRTLPIRPALCQFSQGRLSTCETEEESRVSEKLAALTAELDALRSLRSDPSPEA